ncbi:hypothetical protein GCK32_004042 [Trichostrongylus colubriformis]|uniref:Uncharacterized protein n=1 Tax=Trichostrongylus colubriformis TaxID=6319 RepID=A0AAN8FJB6_TRICO
MFNSQNTRRQIRIQKKKIIGYIEAFSQILRDNNIPETIPEATFQQFNDEEITDIQEEIVDARNNLLKTYLTRERLHTEWFIAQEDDPNEALEFTQYLERYGDSTKTIQGAVSALDNSDNLLNRLDVEIAKRHIPTRSDEYEENPQQPLQAQQQANNQPRQKSTFTTNFVDASIVSKLDLPSFNGNLLEYLEFFARFSTLIGDKTELDDATEFFLLKSCLRGRALHSIEGLALTASNYHIVLDLLKTRYDDKKLNSTAKASNTHERMVMPVCTKVRGRNYRKNLVINANPHTREEFERQSRRPESSEGVLSSPEIRNVASTVSPANTARRNARPVDFADCMRRHHTTLCFRTSTQQQGQRKKHHDKFPTASSNLKQKEARIRQVHFASSSEPSITQQQGDKTIGNEIVASTSSYEDMP